MADRSWGEKRGRLLRPLVDIGERRGAHSPAPQKAHSSRAMPESMMVRRYFSVSRFTRSANCSGVLPTTA